METFPGIAHQDLLKLVFSIAALLGTARLLGEGAQRLGQPAVVGEILAGVVLGPSLLSGLIPAFGRLLLPQTQVQAHLLDAVALIGIVFLMIVVGMETDLGLIRARWRQAAGIAIGGLIVPFLFGLVAGLLVPESLLTGGRRVLFALFLAVALALSAIPVLAKILSDLGLLRRGFGQTALAAGMIDDILGWTMLGLVVSLASARGIGVVDLVMSVGAILVFFLATYVLARPLASRGLDLVLERARSRDATLTLVVTFAFAWGAFSQALNLEPILGAFAAGILFGQLRHVPVEVGRRLESITNGIFAPIFLATAGLRLRIDQLLEPRLLALTLGLFLVAAAGKLLGGYLGGRFLAGIPGREALSYGVALNARGVLGIIVATVGLSLGIFGVEVYSMVVVTSILTSILTPIGLERLLPDRGHAEAETERVNSTRVLLPVRFRETGGDEVHALEAAALSSLGPPDSRVTLLSVVESDQRGEADRYLRELEALFPDTVTTRRRVRMGPAVEVIVEEASKGFDLLALGAPERREGDAEFLFGNVLDDLIRLSPCPSLVFTARGGHWPPRNILVPTGGSAAAARAARLAFSIAGPLTTIIIFHVVDPESMSETGLGRGSSTAVRLDIAQGLVDELREEGERAGIRVVSEVVMGSGMTSGILERARGSVDLVVLGTNVRTGGQRLFLGPKVERIVGESPCSVLVLNT